MRERWALVLAGGDGKRLEPVTRRLHGDERPKQFASVVGDETLLTMTLRRTAELISPTHTVLVFTRKHQPYFEPYVRAGYGPLTLVQPEGRGTAAAICWGIEEITALDSDAVVGLIPSDHFYSNESALLRSMEDAYSEAERTGQVIILGAKPEGPETSFGWIELAESCEGKSAAVAALWEKPDARTARSLYERGCLWNTFILVGSAAAFIRLVHDTQPTLMEHFFRKREEAIPINEIYRSIEPIDFSHQIIVPSGTKLRTLCLGDVGWSDLGEPARASEIMMRHGTPRQRALAREALPHSTESRR